MTFKSRYGKHDPSKSYVIMDDSTLTEQQGYKTTTELYEDMVRSGKMLAAHRLNMSYEDYLEHEDESPFELRYELDPVEQGEIFADYKARFEAAVKASQAAQKEAENQQKNSGNFTSESHKNTGTNDKQNDVQNDVKNT